LDEAVDGFEDAVVDAGLEPVEDAGLMLADRPGRLDDRFETAVCERQAVFPVTWKIDFPVVRKTDFPVRGGDLPSG